MYVIIFNLLRRTYPRRSLPFLIFRSVTKSPFFIFWRAIVRKKCGWYPSLVPRLISAWAVQKRVKKSSQGWIFFRSSDDKTAQSSQTYPVLSYACRSSHEPSDHFPKSYVELVVPWWVNSSKFWQKNLPPFFLVGFFFQIKYVDTCHEASLSKK